MEGSKYVGDFEGDKKYGQGTYISANGDKYAGAFENELFNGQGTYSYANGDQYIGEFRGLYGMYICRLRQMGVSEGSSLPYSHLK
ncbi:MAG: hypothetical protein HOJ24_10900 [Rhodobacteraceae bacterium]|jgi:hypothetical protein|nr:hypothetical protein [Paracoccaceae bacterium]